MQVGVFIKNVNSPSMGRGSTLQYLPRKLVMGISYIPLEKLNTHFNLETLLGYKDIHFSFGFEYEINHMFVLRSGIMMKPNRFGFGFSYSPTNKIAISFGALTHPVLPVSNNLEIGDIYKKKLEKGEFYFAEIEAEVINILKELQLIIPEILKSYSWKKSMKWSIYDLSWGRPLKSIIALFNSEVINFNFFHIQSNNLTLIDGIREDKIKKINNYRSYLHNLKSQILF